MIVCTYNLVRRLAIEFCLLMNVGSVNDVIVQEPPLPHSKEKKKKKKNATLFCNQLAMRRNKVSFFGHLWLT